MQQCTLYAFLFTTGNDSGGLRFEHCVEKLQQCNLCTILILSSGLWKNVKRKCAQFNITCLANSTYTLKLYLFLITLWNLKLSTNFHETDTNPFSWYILSLRNIRLYESLIVSITCSGRNCGKPPGRISNKFWNISYQKDWNTSTLLDGPQITGQTAASWTALVYSIVELRLAPTCCGRTAWALGHYRLRHTRKTGLCWVETISVFKILKEYRSSSHIQSPWKTDQKGKPLPLTILLKQPFLEECRVLFWYFIWTFSIVHYLR
jgi:hypothetical protein